MILKYGSLALILSRFKWEAIASIVPADIQTDGGGGTLVIAPSEICQKRDGQNPERGDQERCGNRFAKPERQEPIL